MLAVALVALPAASALARDAYVVNFGSGTVSVIDTQTNQVVGSPLVIPGAFGIAITPDGKSAYVGETSSKAVSVIDTQTQQVVGSPIKVGKAPIAIAITPDGRTVYVANFESKSVSVIDTQTNQVVGSPIKVGIEPFEIAITPDGRAAYVTNAGSGTVSVIDTQTNQVVGSPITVGTGPDGIAITPDGRTAYVVNGGSKSVSVVNTQTNQVVGSPIKVGTEPGGIAITPDGRTAYVTNGGSKSVSVIDTNTNEVTGLPIAVGIQPVRVTISPDGRTAYVSNEGSKSVSVIDTQTQQVRDPPISVGESPVGIAITPDQPPLASFSISSAPAARARPGVPLALNGSASGDPDGTIATFAWSFGDGQTATAGPSLTHAYSMPGTYQAKLTVTDNEGCSTSVVFTGQTAFCNGLASASQTQTVEVANPGVRVKCPKRAGHRGCRYKLQAVSKKRKGKLETAVATARAKAGKSVIVSLKPKVEFRSKLAMASKILVKETVTSDGSAPHSSYHTLKIVQ